MVVLLIYPRKIYFSSRLQGAATTSFRKPYRSPFTQKFRTFWSDPNSFKHSQHFPNIFSERKLRKPFTSFFQFKPFINFDMFCLVAFRKNSNIGTCYENCLVLLRTFQNIPQNYLGRYKVLSHLNAYVISLNSK